MPLFRIQYGTIDEMICAIDVYTAAINSSLPGVGEVHQTDAFEWLARSADGDATITEIESLTYDDALEIGGLRIARMKGTVLGVSQTFAAMGLPLDDNVARMLIENS